MNEIIPCLHHCDSVFSVIPIISAASFLDMVIPVTINLLIYVIDVPS
ncbi:hypothetical protein ABN075_04795 [Providencia rettgeri]